MQRLTANFIVLVEGDQGQHSGTAHGWSRGIVRAGCRDLGPDVATGSDFACGRAQGLWSFCRSQALESHRRPPMAAGCQSWGCWPWVLGSRGRAPALPGWGCCSQHLVLARDCSHGVFWADCRDLGPDVASGSDFACGRAQGRWSGGCPEVLESCRRPLMAAGWRCWGCWSPVPGSRGTDPAPPGWGCCSQHLVLARGCSHGVF